MLLNKEIISNGLGFTAMQSTKFKSSVLVFSVTVPLCAEYSINNVLLSGLLRRGTHSFPTMASLNKNLDELYGSYIEIRNSTLGNNLSLTVSAEVLDGKYVPDGTDVIGGVIDIISEIFLRPHFCEEAFDINVFEQEKKIFEDNVLAEKNNTRSYSIKRCMELMSEGVSLAPAHTELIPLIRSTSFADVKDYFVNVLARSPLNVFFIGSEDPEYIREKISQGFFKKDFTLTHERIPLLPYSRKEFSCICEKMAVSQGKLALGFSTGTLISSESDEYYTAMMFNEIFGGSPSSKLFLNVREKMSLCYFCSSSYSIYNGTVLVSCGIDPSKHELTKRAILDQLQQIREGNISESELAAARKSISNSYLQIYDSPFDIQAFYSGRRFFGVDDSIEKFIQKIMRVTKDQIKALANKVSLDAEFFVDGTEGGDDGEEDFDND